MIAHHALIAKHLCRQGLHHHNRVCSHPVAIVELLRHTKDKDIIFLLCPVDIGSLVCKLPALRHHLLCIAGVDRDLSALRVQDGITAEERMAHFLLHVHRDLVELVPHQRAIVYRREVCTVHHLRDMVACNASPVRDSGRAVLITTAVAAIGVALHMADQNGKIRVKYGLVHEHGIPALCGPEVDHVVGILGVMACDLTRMPERLKELRSEDGLGILLRAPGMEAIGDDKPDVLLLHAGFIKILQDVPAGELSVAGLLLAPLDAVRNDKNNPAALVNQLLYRRHSNRVIQALPVSRFQFLLRDAGRIRHRHTGNKNICPVRKLCSHRSCAVLKLKMFHDFSFSFFQVLIPAL